MKRYLPFIIGRGGPPKAPDLDAAFPSAAPAQPFVAVGDIHGRADLLVEIDRLIETRCPGWPVVFLGDYVDRGDRSREVLELLMSVSPDGTPPVTCLLGNHERMMLDFLDDPLAEAPRWLRNGGLQTLASFGIAPPRGASGGAGALEDVRDRLVAEMGTAMIDWLRGRPLSWHTGNVWAVHAAADPHLPLTDQADEVLIWGHPEFRRIPRMDGQWVVHGHTIVDEPHARNGRIAVDTGAYATGCLSAAAISVDGVEFLRTAGP